MPNWQAPVRNDWPMRPVPGNSVVLQDAGHEYRNALRTTSIASAMHAGGLFLTLFLSEDPV
jgi:hypothetical protein